MTSDSIRSTIPPSAESFAKSDDGALFRFDRLDGAICALVAVVIAVAFGRAVGCGFVNYDDDVYIYENTFVAGGLTWSGVRWAFLGSYDPCWAPLTWLSFMLDASLFGVKNPGGFHLVNIVLHAATAIIFYLVLRRMTGRRWASALAVLLFAVHPLRVESVAWVTERKDVLSGLLFALTLAAYVGYVRRPSWRRYFLVALVFTLGLLAKQILVTVPFILLLLDYWPLGRGRGARGEGSGDLGISGFRDFGISGLEKSKAACGFALSAPNASPPTFRRLVREKLPLFALSLAAGCTTLWMERLANQPHDHLPLGWRIGNAATSCVTYLGQMLWPADLVIIRPLPDPVLVTWQVAAAATLLLAISVAVWFLRRKCPYWFVGWFWYLIFLAPVLGIVQFGIIAVSDRFTYLPQIGLCIAVAWTLDALVRAWPRLRMAVIVAAVCIIAALVVGSFRQTATWRNSETLWRHALACTTDNYVAELNYGVWLNAQERKAEAKTHLEKAMQIKRDHNIGNCLRGAGKYTRGVDKTIEEYWKDAKPPKRDPAATIPED